ncbi:MAG: acetolactate synthase [Actinomycetota bacterium]
MEANGGHLVAEALKRNGVDVIYTLSGGHIFPIYDGCVARDIRIVDVRHEQTATFAAEAHGKLTGDVGVAVLTAGPGVTNGVSAITSAHFNGSPVLVLGGRAPQGRWGSGSLQEMDHVPVVQSITKSAGTVFEADRCAVAVNAALHAARTPHRGPVFLDFPMDALFVTAEGEVPDPTQPETFAPNGDDLGRAVDLLGSAQRPVIVASTDIWLAKAHEKLRSFVEAQRIPVVLNGMGRGLLPADHELVFARARSTAFKGADVVLVIGTPLDFRLGFGNFGEAQVIHVQDHPDQISTHASPAVGVGGDLATTLDAFAGAPTKAIDARNEWLDVLRDDENARREKERPELEDDTHPIHPARVYGVLRSKLDKDAVVIGDGGDFVSYAGKLVDVFEPGCWLDPGPFGCLGTGLGYAIAARVVHPGRQVVLMAGDGALGFSGMDLDTLVRLSLPVVIVVGNNGIWGLEKHPMKAIYGYDVAADLNQDARYEDILKAFGGAGETVEKATELSDALDRGLASGVPYLVNVHTDPANAYPRSSNLA